MTRAAKPRGLPKASPLYPPDYEIEEAYAMQALYHGRASEEQQRRAMRYILVCICAKDDVSFRPGPDGARLTDFAEGKRFVARQIEKFANLDIPRLFKRPATEQGTPREPKENP